MTRYDRRTIVLRLACAMSAALAPNTLLADRGRGRGGRDEVGRDKDHDDAYAARVAGDIMPLEDILADVRSKLDGELVGVEFDYEEAIPVYELKMIRAGRYFEVYVDARNGAVLKIEGE